MTEKWQNDHSNDVEAFNWLKCTQCVLISLVIHIEQDLVAYLWIWWECHLQERYAANSC